MLFWQPFIDSHLRGNDEKGFTLLEVLIALTLFTLISISLMQMTDTSTQYRKKITRNIKDTKSSRKALQIIRKDIRNIFYKKDMNVLIYNELKDTNSQDDTQKQKLNDNETKVNSQLANWSESEIYPYIPRVHFPTGIIGKQDSLHITSRSYIRHQENEKTSDQNIIIYYLKPCKSREDSKKQSTCLWRKFSSHIEQDLESISHSNYKEFVLLEKVKTFEFSYYDFPGNDWLQEWRTSPNKRNTLPYAIHIKMAFENRKKQIVKQELHLPLHQQFLLPVQ